MLTDLPRWILGTSLLALTACGGGGSGSPDAHVGDGAIDGNGSCTTTITATVFDASHTLKLPNVKIYVPNGALPTPTHGPGSCTAIGSTIGAVATTGNDGIANLSVDLSDPFPVVAQIGKWRVSQMVTTPCVNNPITFVLPGSPSQGAMPKIAVSTGQGDSLECSLHRMGIDAAVTVFHGTGGANAAAPASTTLWQSTATLAPYDAVLLSCEQAETAGVVRQAIHDYAAQGGYVFAEHYGYNWFNAAPFATESLATWTVGPQNLGSPTNAVFGSADPRRTWLETTGALNASHELPLLNADNNIATVGASATNLLNANASATVPNAPLLLSWAEPIAAGVGRIVYADFHIGSASGDYGLAPGQLGVPANSVYPTGCAATALTAAEKAFMYTLYEDLNCP